MPFMGSYSYWSVINIFFQLVITNHHYLKSGYSTAGLGNQTLFFCPPPNKNREKRCGYVRLQNKIATDKVNSEENFGGPDGKFLVVSFKVLMGKCASFTKIFPSNIFLCTVHTTHKRIPRIKATLQSSSGMRVATFLDCW